MTPDAPVVQSRCNKGTTMSNLNHSIVYIIAGKNPASEIDEARRRYCTGILSDMRKVPGAKGETLYIYDGYSWDNDREDITAIENIVHKFAPIDARRRPQDKIDFLHVFDTNELENTEFDHRNGFSVLQRSYKHIANEAHGPSLVLGVQLEDTFKEFLKPRIPAKELKSYSGVDFSCEHCPFGLDEGDVKSCYNACGDKPNECYECSYMSVYLKDEVDEIFRSNAAIPLHPGETLEFPEELPEEPKKEPGTSPETPAGTNPLHDTIIGSEPAADGKLRKNPPRTVEGRLAFMEQCYADLVKLVKEHSADIAELKRKEDSNE